MAFDVDKGRIVLQFPCTTDLSAKQYRFVKLSSGNVVAITSATDIPIGVLQNTPDGIVGESADVCLFGVTKIEADAALSQGDWIGPSADGQADLKVIGTDATEFICGRMLTAASGVGAVGTAAINCITPHNAVTAN